MKELVFNDVSIGGARFANREVVRTLIETLARVAATLIRNESAIPILRSMTPLEELLFLGENGASVNYGFVHFYQDRGVDHDTRLFLLHLSKKVPLLEDSLPIDAEVRHAFLLTEFFVGTRGGPKCPALGLASLLQAIGISVCSLALWDSSELSILPLVLTDDELTEGPATNVAHAATLQHCEKIAERLLYRRREDVRDGSELWREIGNLFPALRFSPDVAGNLERIPRELVQFVVSRLARMEQCARNWRTTGSPHPPEEFTVKSESEATLNQFSEARTFRLPGSDQRAVFALHTPISSRHRIHFRVDYSTRSFVIGYIGDHLPTARFR